LESEVFLLGHWKNFDELESSLSLEELIVIIEALRKKDNDDKRFTAAVNGVDIEEDETPNDITELKSSNVASSEGFGINEGLGFMQMEG
jgi:hypothetical protein